LMGGGLTICYFRSKKSLGGKTLNRIVYSIYFFFSISSIFRSGEPINSLPMPTFPP
jgi:hypothetical protein